MRLTTRHKGSRHSHESVLVADQELSDSFTDSTQIHIEYATGLLETLENHEILSVENCKRVKIQRGDQEKMLENVQIAKQKDSVTEIRYTSGEYEELANWNLVGAYA